MADQSYCKKRARELIRKGEIIPKTYCEDCSHGLAQMYHPDYSKPREIIWLCPKCQAKLRLMKKAGQDTPLSNQDDIATIVKKLTRDEELRDIQRNRLVVSGEWTELQAAEDRKHWERVISAAQDQYAIAMGYKPQRVVSAESIMQRENAGIEEAPEEPQESVFDKIKF